MRLFLKYGRHDLLRASEVDLLTGDDDAPGPSDPRDPNVPTVHERPGEVLDQQRRIDGNGDEPAPAAAEPADPVAERAAGLVHDLEALGPTFIKVGQFLSTRGDLLPPVYLEALSRLQDRVGPFPFAEVERIVAEELGVRISKAFAVFEDVPIAAASLGQVHRAQLRSGRWVAVKVQRPDIRDRILVDLEALEEIAAFLDQHTELGRRQGFVPMVDQFRRTLLEELDYRLEARHLSVVGENLAGLSRILVPRPVEDLVTSRVLTMELVHGRKVTALGPLAKLEVDGAPLAEELCRAYLQQILVDGLFHADPHPGNVFLTDDGRLALIDLGQVAQLAPGLQEDLLKLVLAIGEGRGEDAGSIVARIGTPMAGSDAGEVQRRIAERVVAFQGLRMHEIALGRLLFDAARVASEGGFRMPHELTMLGKALLNVDEVARRLDPDFEPNASIRRNASEIMRRRMMKSISPGRLFAGLLEMKEFAEKLPRRLNHLIEAVAENRVRVRVDAIDEVFLMQGLQKIANRITLGLVISAMIVGAALLMRIETRFRILGYPGLAMLFFIGAALGAGVLVLNILFGDVRAGPQPDRADEKGGTTASTARPRG